jgi:mRNA interferase RelE/StbE
MYKILLERRAERDLRRLSAGTHERVTAAIRGLAANPRPLGCCKLAGSENDWRIRVGNHRVVYEIAVRYSSRARQPGPPSSRGVSLT